MRASRPLTSGSEVLALSKPITIIGLYSIEIIYFLLLTIILKRRIQIG
jgi:hypothetical protein